MSQAPEYQPLLEKEEDESSISELDPDLVVIERPGGEDKPLMTPLPNVLIGEAEAALTPVGRGHSSSVGDSDGTLGNESPKIEASIHPAPCLEEDLLPPTKVEEFELPTFPPPSEVQPSPIKKGWKVSYLLSFLLFGLMLAFSFAAYDIHKRQVEEMEHQLYTLQSQLSLEAQKAEAIRSAYVEALREKHEMMNKDQPFIKPPNWRDSLAKLESWARETKYGARDWAADTTVGIKEWATERSSNVADWTKEKTEWIQGTSEAVKDKVAEKVHSATASIKELVGGLGSRFSWSQKEEEEQV